MQYRVVEIDLSDSAGRLQVDAGQLNSYAAALPAGQAASIRLGNGDPLPLDAFPVLRSGCGPFGSVLLEWTVGAGTLRVVLGRDLDTSVVVA